MPIEVLDPQGFAAAVAELVGGAPDSDGAIAECFRAELSARTCARGADVRRWAAERLQRTEATAIQQVEAVWSDLEAAREVLVDPEGMAHPGPLRLIRRPDAWARVLCGAPRTTVEALVGAQLTMGGVRRTVADDDRVRDAVLAAGGLVLMLDAWCGFDDALPAGPRFLESLDARLAAADDGPVATAPVGPWQGFDPGDGNLPPRWHADVVRARLWRAWPSSGRPVFAYTQHDARPGPGRMIQLWASDANRAAYALLDAVHEGFKVEISAAADRPGTLRLALPLHVPTPEYRWLSEVAELDRAGGSGGVCSLPEGLRAAVEAMLASRLGLVTKDIP